MIKSRKTFEDLLSRISIFPTVSSTRSRTSWGHFTSSRVPSPPPGQSTYLPNLT